MVGETISHFRIIDKLGQGGMGEVYLAEDTKLDRKVALKFLPDSLHQDPARRGRRDHSETLRRVDETDSPSFTASSRARYTPAQNKGTPHSLSRLTRLGIPSNGSESHRETAMLQANNVKFMAAVGVALSFFSAAGICAQVNEEVNNRADPYSMNQDFFKLPAGRKIGGTAGITLDPDGRSIWVFERCGSNTNCVGSDLAPILKFDARGNLVKSFGAGLFVRPHGIHIDPQGNVWVTDADGPDGQDPRRDGKGHQVFKFSPDGELLMTLGKAGVAGDGPDEFNRPSAVFVAPSGEIFVGDGHGGESNARMMKFSKDGRFIKTWGKEGEWPGRV